MFCASTKNVSKKHVKLIFQRRNFNLFLWLIKIYSTKTFLMFRFLRLYTNYYMAFLSRTKFFLWAGFWCVGVEWFIYLIVNWYCRNHYRNINLSIRVYNTHYIKTGMKRRKNETKCLQINLVVIHILRILIRMSSMCLIC